MVSKSFFLFKNLILMGSSFKNHVNLGPCLLSGFLEVCKMIIDKVEDKNPKDPKGRTPLHAAAAKGFEEICKLIIDNIGKATF